MPICWIITKGDWQWNDKLCIRNKYLSNIKYFTKVSLLINLLTPFLPRNVICQYTWTKRERYYFAFCFCILWRVLALILFVAGELSFITLRCFPVWGCSVDERVSVFCQFLHVNYGSRTCTSMCSYSLMFVPCIIRRSRKQRTLCTEFYHSFIQYTGSYMFRQ
jgi:hypothetical protein